MVSKAGVQKGVVPGIWEWGKSLVETRSNNFFQYPVTKILHVVAPCFFCEKLSQWVQF